MAVKGIDVSEHQGIINFPSVANDGIEFVIIRDGYGFSTTDNQFMRNVAQAKSIGVKIPATFHFSYALSKEDAEEEAKFAIKLAEEAGLDKSTIIFYDLEYECVDEYAKDPKRNHLGKVVNITKTKASEMAQAFCEKVKAAGYRAGIYANTDYLDRMFTKTVINKYILWHADYRKGAKADPRAMFFQSSSTGRINGINGNVDLDTYLGDVALQGNASSVDEPKKSNEELAKEVIAGKWGNGDTRKKKLEAAGYDYNAVQKIVNELVAPKPALKPVNDIAHEVIAGKWGNGDDRKKKLTEAGYDYNAVQKIVNELVAKSPAPVNGKTVSPAMSRDDKLAGTYTVNVDALNMRYKPNVLTSDNVIKVLRRGEKIQNYGFYTQFGNSKWLLIQSGDVTGWVSMAYLGR